MQKTRKHEITFFHMWLKVQGWQQ